MLVACAGQERGHYDRDPWADYDPYDRKPTYDEGYVLDADRLVARAKKAENNGRDDQARVDYHQAFRRDRWHPGANDAYQDLMLRNGLFDKLWQEYLDLWQQNPERGDAFWYHLRPMLSQRADQPIPPGRKAKVSESDQSRIDEYVLDAKNLARDGDKPAAKETIERAIATGDWPELHILRIRFSTDEQINDLLNEYADRLEENPASGDAVALHALSVARSDPHTALGELRDAWILEYPGLWLEYAIATVCAAIPEEVTNDDESVRSAVGWLTAAVAFGKRFEQSRPSGVAVSFDVAELESRLKLIPSTPTTDQ